MKESSLLLFLTLTVSALTFFAAYTEIKNTLFLEKEFLDISSASAVGEENGSPVVLLASATSRQHFTMTPVLEKNLGTLFGALKKEIALCLTGRQEGNVAIAIGFEMPPHVFSKTDRAKASISAKCPSSSIAWWHNHPNGDCRLSRPDYKTALSVSSKFPFVVIQGGEHEWCWWSARQLPDLPKRYFRNSDGEKTFAVSPPPGQLVYPLVFYAYYTQ